MATILLIKNDAKNNYDPGIPDKTVVNRIVADKTFADEKYDKLFDVEEVNGATEHATVNWTYDVITKQKTEPVIVEPPVKTIAELEAIMADLQAEIDKLKNP